MWKKEGVLTKNSTASRPNRNISYSEEREMQDWIMRLEVSAAPLKVFAFTGEHRLKLCPAVCLFQPDISV